MKSRTRWVAIPQLMSESTSWKFSSSCARLASATTLRFWRNTLKVNSEMTSGNTMNGALDVAGGSCWSTILLFQVTRLYFPVCNFPFVLFLPKLQKNLLLPRRRKKIFFMIKLCDYLNPTGTHMIEKFRLPSLIRIQKLTLKSPNKITCTLPNVSAPCAFGRLL